jgi:hypothetical protein
MKNYLIAFFAFGIFSTSTLQAQKMNIIDYHKAFVDNMASPKNSLLSKYSPKWVEEGGGIFLHENIGGEVEITELSVASGKNYLKYKRFKSTISGNWIEFENGTTY